VRKGSSKGQAGGEETQETLGVIITDGACGGMKPSRTGSTYGPRIRRSCTRLAKPVKESIWSFEIGARASDGPKGPKTAS